MARNSQHVFPHLEGGWSVRKYGSTHVTRRFRTQREAITFGRRISKKQGSVFVIHRRDGTVKSVKSYEKASQSLGNQR